MGLHSTFLGNFPFSFGVFAQFETSLKVPLEVSLFSQCEHTRSLGTRVFLNEGGFKLRTSLLPQRSIEGTYQKGSLLNGSVPGVFFTLPAHGRTLHLENIGDGAPLLRTHSGNFCANTLGRDKNTLKQAPLGQQLKGVTHI